jgi:hypothetical protein
MQMDHTHVGQEKGTIGEALADASAYIKDLKTKAINDRQVLVNFSHSIVVTGDKDNPIFTATVIAVTQHRTVDH